MIVPPSFFYEKRALHFFEYDYDDVVKNFFRKFFSTFFAAMVVFLFHPASIFADDAILSQEHGKEDIGSIRVCKVIIDQDGNINNGLTHEGMFSFPEVEDELSPTVPPMNRTLPVTRFVAPLVLNADLFGNDGMNDAQCVTHRGLHLGSYFYAPESITGFGWAIPLYNDQYTVTVTTLADFFPYSRHFSSGEEPDEDKNSGGWNENSDGHIVLSAGRPDRTLIVLNRYLERTPPIPTNHAPVITLLGATTTAITLGEIFTDPGATAHDEEDGDIATSSIMVTTDTVSTTTPGTYILRYNVKDSGGLAAEEKIRTVTVNEVPVCSLPEFANLPSVRTTTGTAFSYIFTATSSSPTMPIFSVATSSLPAGLSFFVDTISGTTTVEGIFNVLVGASNMCGASTITLSIIVDPGNHGGGSGGNDGGGGTSLPFCSDRRDNDGDGKIDSEDPSCHADGNSEHSDTYVPAGTTENSAPVITLLGATTTAITLGEIFTDPGATAHDEEDGDIATSSIMVTTDTVSTTTPGTYILRYNVKDSGGLAAEEKIRTIEVNILPSGGGGGGEGGGGTGIGNTGGGGIGTSGCSGNCGSGGSIGASFLPQENTSENAPSECSYIHEFIKFGADNNSDEVKKLQIFLDSFEGTHLAVSGIYDVETMNALSAFQAKYKSEILDPWGYNAPTGYVYLMTRKQINEMYCRAVFPLDSNQTAEVMAFRNFLESLKAQGTISRNTVSGENTETGNEATSSLRFGENKNILPLSPVIGSATEKNTFRNMLGAAYMTLSRGITTHRLIFLIALFVIVGIILRKFATKEPPFWVKIR